MKYYDYYVGYGKDKRINKFELYDLVVHNKRMITGKEMYTADAFTLNTDIYRFSIDISKSNLSAFTPDGITFRLAKEARQIIAAIFTQ